MDRIEEPILCWVSDRRAIAVETGTRRRDALIARIRLCADAGLDWLQLREKDLDSRALAELTTEAIKAVEGAGRDSGAVRIIVNDRLDVAWAAHAGGVHLGEGSLPTLETAQLRRPNFLVGRSCHSVESARSAEAEGADYVFFGPVFATPSKASFGSPQGLAALAEACGATSIPVVAIGGVTLANAESCMEAGAAGIAAITMFQDSPDPADLAASLRKVLGGRI